MEILFRSIARAGGIEVAPEIRAAPLQPRPVRRWARAAAARGLRLAGMALCRAGRRLAADLPPAACPVAKTSNLPYPRR